MSFVNGGGVLKNIKRKKSKSISKKGTKSKKCTKSKKSTKSKKGKKGKKVVIGNNKKTNAQLKELNELENYILNRRNIEQQIYKQQMISNAKLNKRDTPAIIITPPKKKSKSKKPIKVTTIKAKNTPYLSSPRRLSSTASPRRSSTTMLPRRSSTVTQQTPINTISRNDITNIDSEIQSSSLRPPSYPSSPPPSYHSSPPPSYNLEDISPTIKKMSMVNYDDKNALSYRNEDLSYRD